MRTLDRNLPPVYAGEPDTRCETTRLVAASDQMRLAGDLDSALRYAQLAYGADPCARSEDGCDRHASIWFALLLTQIRRTARAGGVLDKVVAGSRNAQVTAAVTIGRASIAATEGRLDEAATLAGGGLRAAAEAGMSAWTPVAHLILAVAALHRDDLPTAVRCAHDLEQDSIFCRPGCPSGQVAWTIMRIEEACNGSAAAAPLAAELLLTRQLATDLLLAQPAAAPWLVRFALDRGERGMAEEGVRLAGRLASANRYFPSVGVAAIHAEGLLRADEKMLAIAADNHLDRFARASALEDLGICQAKMPDGRFKAIVTLERAGKGYAKIGAARDRARVLNRLGTLIGERD